MQPTFANKTLIWTYPLLHYLQAVMLFLPHAMHVLGLLYNPAGTKLPNSCVLTLSERVKDEKQSDVEKQERLWTNGNGACTSPLSVTQRKELLTCVHDRQGFKMCKGPLIPTASV